MSSKTPVDATRVDTHVGVAETIDSTAKTGTPVTADHTVATPSPEVPTGTGASRIRRPTALVAGMMVGEYKVEAKLGEGGMGAVYGAVHPLIGKRAAIKVLKPELCSNPEAVERFVQEARSVNQIGHPNIVDIFSFGELPDGSSYFVMEQLRGETLAQRLRRGRLAFGECLEILDGVIRGLEAAHDKGIIHRDLKPDNVFLVEVRGDRPQVKLLDFGIAKLTGGEDNRLERTRTGALIGTPQYIAPEQARGYAVDHRADIYSLGVMAFEMFTGRPPFQADTAMDMISKHLHETPPRPSTVVSLPFALDRAILEMLDKSPANRPSLPEVREVFEACRTSVVNVALVGTVPDASLPLEVAKQRRSRAVGLAVAGVLLLGAGAAGIYFATRDGDAAPAKPTPEPQARVVVPDAAPTLAVTPDAAPVVDTTLVRIHLTFNVMPRTLLLDGQELPPTRDLIAEVVPGMHDLMVFAPGYRQLNMQLALAPGLSFEKTIELDPIKKGKKPRKPGSGSGTATNTSVGTGVGTGTDDEDGPVNPFDKKKTP